MSQIRRCSIAIKVLNEELAKATLNAIQRIHGGVVTGLRLQWGVYHAFFEIMKTKSGGVQIVGDDFRTPMMLEEFKSLFMQQYNAQAVALALQRMGYRTQQVKLPQAVVVRGARVGGVYG